ncbi:MAG: ATP-binding cassette domain-containing protein [Candidatus Competibacteraceae bacterium]|nr:ATP-binding cassette domain-containing protein [Candidatus Competibacteraceae bacterium]
MKQSDTSSPLLEVRDLAVNFGQTPAVKRVSFQIKAGETLALVGESGSGKSVSALSILQLLPYPSAHHPSGSIRLRGEELLGAPADRLRRLRGNQIAIVFQEPMTSLNPLHSIEQQIGEVLAVHKGLIGQAAPGANLRAIASGGIAGSGKPLGCFAA